MVIVSANSSGPRGSFNQSERRRLNRLRLVNKKKKLACTCHLAAWLFEFKGQHRVPFTGRPQNVQQKRQTHLQGCFAFFFFRLLGSEGRLAPTWPGSQGICTNVIFIAAAIILWDYPCQVNLELEFYICAGSRCQYEPLANQRNFLHFARWMCCCS